jgi:hypothetical protein
MEPFEEVPETKIARRRMGRLKNICMSLTASV